MKSLGKSERVVLAWLELHPASKSQEVSDALYDTTSNCGKAFYAGSMSTPRKQLRASWASKVLQRLKKRDLVIISDCTNPGWSVKVKDA
jgi:hypothetical protein